VYLGDFTAQLTVEAAYREGQRRHIAITPIQSATAVAEDPHLAARGFFAEVDHPTAGRLTYPGAPYRHAETPWCIRRSAPAPGQHNREVYCDELGLGEAELVALQARGVI
jgi:crotonobetainyl-CoA:carnitine CoA-transferase CaiB-like acyl-CoA transferase